MTNCNSSFYLHMNFSFEILLLTLSSAYFLWIKIDCGSDKIRPAVIGVVNAQRYLNFLHILLLECSKML